MSIVIYIIAFIVALGILIVVHEFGHFWVARLMGVKVLRFSVGFGKPLWRREFGRDRTELVVAGIPLGGYVKMLDETEGPVPPADAHRAYNRQSVWKRMPIIAAGPVFNLVFAVLAYWLVNVTGIEGVRPVVGQVAPESIAARAGFEPGDEILTIDGREVQTWGQRRLYLFQRALDGAVVEVEVRDPQGAVETRRLDLGQIPTSEIDASLIERGIGLYGYLPQLLPVVGGLEPGPAQAAGLEVGDRFVAIEGRAVDGWQDVVQRIRARAGEPTRVTVERDGRELTVELTPAPVTVNGETIGRINVRPEITEVPPEMRTQVRLDPLPALAEGVRNTWAMTALTFEMLWHMVTLQVSSENISGPITIAQYAGQTAMVGVTEFMLFLAVISVSLAVLNLLPIPILDGGHLMYCIIEAIKGSPVSERMMIFGQQIGIVLLAGLMALAFYNDLTRIFS